MALRSCTPLAFSVGKVGFWEMGGKVGLDSGKGVGRIGRMEKSGIRFIWVPAGVEATDAQLREL